METWQNIKGAVIPEFLQGRGTGESGGTLYVILGDGIAVTCISANQYVTKMDDGKIIVSDEELIKLW